MIAPAENEVALRPADVAVKRGVVLRPLTVGGMLELSRYGIDLAKPIPPSKVIIAAWVLSRQPSLRRFSARIGERHFEALRRAVEAQVNAAFATYVRPAAEGGSARSLTPCGLGKPLEVAEFLCATYGWGVEEALRTPVSTALAFAAACHQRNGGRFAGLDYEERAYADRLRRGEEEAVRIS